MAEPTDVERLFGAKTDADDHKMYAAYTNWGMKRLQNKSGGTLADGQLVRIDPDNDQGFDQTYSEGEVAAYGIINKLINFTGAGAEELAAQSIANDAWGYVTFWGFIEAGVVTVDASVTNGAYLKADGVTGQLTLASGNMFDGDEAPRGTLAIAYTTDTASAFQPMIFMLGYTATKPLNKYDATTAPTGDDDVDLGYSPGSIWTDVTNDATYICQDATDGAAVWLQMGASGLTEISDTTITTDVASVDITGITSGGGDLIISGFLAPATDNVGLYLRLNNYSGASDYKFAYINNIDAGTIASVADTGDPQMLIAAGEVGNAAAEGIAFEILIPAYANLASGRFPHAFWSGMENRADGTPRALSGGAFLIKAEAITRVTLLFSSGDIADGRLRLFTRGDS